MLYNFMQIHEKKIHAKTLKNLKMNVQSVFYWFRIFLCFRWNPCSGINYFWNLKKCRRFWNVCTRMRPSFFLWSRDIFIEFIDVLLRLFSLFRPRTPESIDAMNGRTVDPNLSGPWFRFWSGTIVSTDDL